MARLLVLHAAALVAALSLALAPPAAAKEGARHALIIANKSYRDAVGPLANPHKDAELMRSALEAVGYSVVVAKDLGRGALLAAVEEHAERLAAAGPAAEGFFYYSGHGAARSNGRNYIIPVTVADAASRALWHDSVPMREIERILRQEAGQAAHIVVFDACRSELRLPVKSIGAVAEKGFRPVTDWGGMLVAYSTAPNSVASDGAPGDVAGPYAQALASTLRQARGIEASTVFSRVRLAVRRKVEGQFPWFLHGLDREVVFGEPEPEPQPNPPTAAERRESAARAAYEALGAEPSAAALEALASAHQGTVWGRLAAQEAATKRALASVEEAERKLAERPSEGRLAVAPYLPLNVLTRRGQAPPPATPEARKQLQSELLRLGDYLGAIDGVWGEGSETAMLAFQRREGLDETGAADIRLLERLKSAEPPDRGLRGIDAVAGCWERLNDDNLPQNTVGIGKYMFVFPYARGVEWRDMSSLERLGKVNPTHTRLRISPKGVAVRERGFSYGHWSLDADGEGGMVVTMAKRGEAIERRAYRRIQCPPFQRG